jgi:hypothetical protein
VARGVDAWLGVYALSKDARKENRFNLSLPTQFINGCARNIGLKLKKNI